MGLSSYFKSCYSLKDLLHEFWIIFSLKKIQMPSSKTQKRLIIIWYSYFLLILVFLFSFKITTTYVIIIGNASISKYSKMACGNLVQLNVYRETVLVYGNNLQCESGRSTVNKTVGSFISKEATCPRGFSLVDETYVCGMYISFSSLILLCMSKLQTQLTVLSQ